MNMTVSPVITRVSLTRIGSEVADQKVNAVGTTRNFTYACWVLRDFSNRRDDVNLDDASNFFLP